MVRDFSRAGKAARRKTVHPKDVCSCGAEKDVRAVLCQHCRMHTMAEAAAQRRADSRVHKAAAKEARRPAPIIKVCPYCKREFVARHRRSKYCSRSCQARGIRVEFPPTPVLERYTVQDRGYSSPCWIFNRSGKCNRGYNQIMLPDGSQPLAHRYFYEQLVGSIPEGLTLDHLCRIRNCVNPAHLEPVTRGENTLRGDTITGNNRRKTQCKRGHAFTPENTRITPQGTRCCRACARERRKRESARAPV